MITKEDERWMRQAILEAEAAGAEEKCRWAP